MEQYSILERATARREPRGAVVVSLNHNQTPERHAEREMLISVAQFQIYEI